MMHGQQRRTQVHRKKDDGRQLGGVRISRWRHNWNKKAKAREKGLNHRPEYPE